MEILGKSPRLIWWKEVIVAFDQRKVSYDFGELDELALAYAITIHKSQGSEFPVVVIPVATQQFLLLQRNLIYTGVTRGRKLVLLVGQKKALNMAVANATSLAAIQVCCTACEAWVKRPARVLLRWKHHP